jgi:hypothetical protein
VFVRRDKRAGLAGIPPTSHLLFSHSEKHESRMLQADADHHRLFTMATSVSFLLKPASRNIYHEASHHLIAHDFEK